MANPWLAALLSWALATGLVVGGYALWQYSHGATLNLGIVRDSAAIAALLAVFRAWRDRSRKRP